MNGINSLESMSSYTANSYVTNKIPSENLEAGKTYKPSSADTQLLPNISGPNSDYLKDSMLTDFTNLSKWSGNSSMYSQDNTYKIDKLVDTAKKYTKYINDNFTGAKKQDYLNSLNGYMNYAKDLISSEISYNIGRFFDLDNNDISGIKNNIDSIIYNRLNNITTTGEATSLKDMNYKDLKILSAGIDGISKSLLQDFYSSSGYGVSTLGMAKMKTNFIVEKTNLSASLKTKLSSFVDNKIAKDLDSIYKSIEFTQMQREVFARERGYSLADITGVDSSSRVKYLKERTLDNYRKFANVKFDMNFMKSFLSIMKSVNKQYSEDIDYYKKIDAKLGSEIAKSISEKQRTITDDLSCDWNDFIDKVYTSEDKSQYYLPASNHNIVDAFA